MATVEQCLLKQIDLDDTFTCTSKSIKKAAVSVVCGTKGKAEASFMTKTVQYQNELHKFLIWDTAGQERFRALAPMYYRGSAAAIIVYDITKEESFQTLKNWVKELRQHGPPNIVVAITGNKCDLSDAREVLEKDAKDYADSIHAIFVETSAKNAININEVFIEISKRIPVAGAGTSGKGFKLGRQESESRRTCC
ncbi:ras-related protein Rab-22A isoform X1 [Phycodurus eques]|uniref:ras-related protein Rab-22A isoform X1 n=1 Tax=Phycodurus eques TaxID=693459 RepID=UPI002ACE992D|nr:ras-related protein Rab-22A isoform X1 [Phycodurus eques]